MLQIKYPVILASQSPRRQQLLKSLAIDFTVQSKNVEEDFPDTMAVEQVPVFLAEKKATAFLPELSNELIITADTIVAIEGHILNKPQHEQEATEMLQLLSGKMHQVVTGVCLLTRNEKITFSDTTNVYFKALSSKEIEYYVQTYQPFDKAGSYGAQEWLGMVAIDKIEGSYFNVMGLPVHQLYDYLKKFTSS